MDWLLPFNVEKCSVVYFRESNSKNVYKMNNIELAPETFIRDYAGSTISG